MFSLDKEQLAKLKEWMEQFKGRNPGGPIGGDFEYIFIPTTLGIVAKVRDSRSGKEIDLTDYESW